MPLPKEVVEVFNNPRATKVLATIDEEGRVHAAPIASLGAVPDGSALFFGRIMAKGTSRRLEYMKKAGKTAVAVAQVFDVPNMVIKGYAVRCEVGEFQTSGPLFEKISEAVKGLGMPVEGVWTLIPVEYKVCSPGPEVGKVVKL